MNIYNINEKRGEPFEHRGHHGTKLRCARADLLGAKVHIFKPAGLDDSSFAEDMAEIIGWWCINIRAYLNGHSGVDCFDMQVTEIEDD